MTRPERFVRRRVDTMHADPLGIGNPDYDGPGSPALGPFLFGDVLMFCQSVG